MEDRFVAVAVVVVAVVVVVVVVGESRSFVVVGVEVGSPLLGAGTGVGSLWGEVVGIEVGWGQSLLDLCGGR